MVPAFPRREGKNGVVVRLVFAVVGVVIILVLVIVVVVVIVEFKRVGVGGH